MERKFLILKFKVDINFTFSLHAFPSNRRCKATDKLLFSPCTLIIHQERQSLSFLLQGRFPLSERCSQGSVDIRGALCRYAGNIENRSPETLWMENVQPRFPRDIPIISQTKPLREVVSSKTPLDRRSKLFPFRTFFDPPSSVRMFFWRNNLESLETSQLVTLFSRNSRMKQFSRFDFQLLLFWTEKLDEIWVCLS